MLTPYEYQKRVHRALMQRKNIILLIPTGMGKTRTAILPFSQSRARGDDLLPAKALYVVPMRVLATQFKVTCEDLYKNELNPERFQEIEATYKQFQRELISIQTGESPEDPQFESMITACTIDQMLSGALGIPYGLDNRKANLNVGAIASSYLILDEPHLYPVSQDGSSYKGAFTTCLELLRLLKCLTRFVFMSATMSKELVKRLCTLLDAELIELDDEELEELNKGRSRVFTRSIEPISVEQILQEHDQQHYHCSLVVCNTVQRAQETYIHFSETIAHRKLAIELRLLHSRFTDEDRKKQGKELGELLGKEQWKEGIYQGEKDVIVVATQVVEVGLDISVQTLHTELAPANSLVQRAGRCARFEQQQGHVIVYPLPLNEEGKPASTLPYRADLCQSTWDALAEFDDRVMGFREEQQLINCVHTADDLALLDRYEQHRDDLQRDITTMLQTSERGNASTLIRDVNQIQLIIHDDPDTELKIRPWRWQSFGLHPSALLGKHWKQLRERQQACDLSWLCKQAEKDKKEQQDEEEDHRLPIIYNWPPITEQNQISGALMIAMSQQLVTYDKDLGLVFLDGRIALPPAWKQLLESQNYQSGLLPPKFGKSDSGPTRIQSYKQHIGGLADAYHYAIYHELYYAMRCLEDLMHLEADTIDHAIQLAIAAHDLGKLDAQWQRWARAWQRLLYEKKQWSGPYQEKNASFFFAKTDYDYQSQEQREWQKELPIKRPRHACESAMTGRSLIMQSLGVNSPDSPNIPVVRAVCSAIAHHHTPTAHEYGATKISAQAQNAIKNAFDVVCRDGDWNYDLERLRLTFEKGDLCPVNASTLLLTQPDVASGPEKLLETWLAFLIVRALRLADQRADFYL
jgi:CRISPR-associated endonuclease/helicase Cas3